MACSRVSSGICPTPRATTMAGSGLANATALPFAVAAAVIAAVAIAIVVLASATTVRQDVA